jgi:two-component system CheB/CheR fusion protein
MSDDIKKAVAVGETPTSGLPAAAEESSESSGSRSNVPAFPVVGIGASAGGMAAFKSFLSALPVDSGMSFVIIQHLAPQHASQLTQLLAKECVIPVVEATDGVQIRPDQVYVIPPNVDMALSNGCLRMTPRESARGLHLSIDFFLRSLAQECPTCAIGVVLSGSGADGTLGLAEIKSAGGITFVQDPKSAESSEMPSSAILYGCADFILLPGEIAHEIVRMSRHAYLRDRTLGSVADPFPEDADSYGQVLALLKDVSGIDFSLYRSSTIKRRIQRRMAMQGTSSLRTYTSSLQASPKELAALVKDVLINVTNFFRDQEAFEAIRTLVFPELVKFRNAGSAIRIWVVACATGQEAYSIAIALIEFFETARIHPSIQIFATDISETSLSAARAGIYPASIEAEVSPERLRRHFIKQGNSYRINKSIRDICVFARHDITADTPFSKIDFISCRNVLIYLTPALQMRVIATFHYTLRPSGFLLLGSSETVGRSGDLFEAVDAKNRVFLKKASGVRGNSPTFPAHRPLVTAMASRVPTVGDLQRAADRIMLERFAPASVLVDDSLNVLQFRGNTKLYLQHPQGEASLNLMKMVHFGLAQELTTAIAEAKTTQATVCRQSIRLREEQRLRLIDIEVSSIRLPGSIDASLLVLFKESPESLSHTAEATTGASEIPSSFVETDAYRQLRQELQVSNDHLQALIAENSAVNDELRFANDEAFSSNEELRCTNEELQTAKEEFQSANEELTTLNEELRHSGDMAKAIVETVRDPELVLDAELRVQSVNRAFYRVFGHSHEDPIGEFIYRLGGEEWNIPELRKLLQEILLGGVPMDDFEVVHEFARIGRRVMLLSARLLQGSTGSGRMIVLAIVDITEQRRLAEEARKIQEVLRQSGDLAKAIVETVHDPLLVLDAELRICTVNRAFFRVFDYVDADPTGELIYHLGDGEWDMPELRRLLEGILQGGPAMDDFEVSHNFARIGSRTMRLNARLLEGASGTARMLVLAIADVTVQKALSDALKNTSTELRRSNQDLNQFAMIASHDLQEPLRMISNYTDLLQKRLGDTLDAKSLQFFGFVIDGASRMRSLIHAILDYSHVGREEIRTQVIDIQEIIRATSLNLERKIHDASAKITCGAMPRITADPVLISQLFQNLVSNAIKFRAKDRPVQISIQSSESEEEWTFSVNDNGIGISAANIDRLFVLFQRLHTHNEYPGTGIGLATCKKIVERHGGRIYVESTLGVGSTFFFTIPKS